MSIVWKNDDNENVDGIDVDENENEDGDEEENPSQDSSPNAMNVGWMQRGRKCK